MEKSIIESISKENLDEILEPKLVGIKRVEELQAKLDIAIAALKEILLCWPEYNSGLTAKRYLEKLGEL